MHENDTTSISYGTVYVPVTKILKITTTQKREMYLSLTTSAENEAES